MQPFDDFQNKQVDVWNLLTFSSFVFCLLLGGLVGIQKK